MCYLQDVWTAAYGRYHLQDSSWQHPLLLLLPVTLLLLLQRQLLV
jgi:hypothetical protein